MSAAVTRPAFAPPPGLELLLQVVLCEPERARQAWLAWNRATIFDDIGQPEFRLMGEVAQRVDAIDPGFIHRARVMGMKKYVWSNNIHIIQPLLPVLDALNERGFPYLVLKGGGVMAADPTELHRRFIRDIDLMVWAQDIPKVSHLLLDMGWRASTGRIPGRLRAQPFDKRMPGKPHGQDKAEIDLHRSALHFGRYGRIDEGFFARAVSGALLGRPVKYLCANDRALVSSLHGLIWNDEPSFSWVTDAVRAFRAEDFDWEVFLADIERRKLQEHARLVLSYLDGAFDIGLTQAHLARLDSPMHRALFGAEIRAIGQTREARGVKGRFAMMAAEFLRSRAVTNLVDYRTDFGIRMKPSSTSPELTAISEAGYAFAVSRLSDARIAIDMRVAEPGERMDFDFWHDKRWLGRLKIRQRSGAGNHAWTGTADVPRLEGEAPERFRVTVAPAD